MAYFRQIHVSIWKDEWFLELGPEEKLLFIYLFSNESTNLAGFYKIALKVICFETGLDPGFVDKTLDKFAGLKKVFYGEGVVWVVNMRRYHETSSSKVQIRIAKDLSEIPDSPLKIAYLEYQDTLSIGYQYPSIRRGKKRKEEEEEKDNGRLYDLFEKEIGLLTPTIADEIGDWIDTYPNSWVEDAIKEAARSNVRKASYVNGILRNWQSEGKGDHREKEEQFVEME